MLLMKNQIYCILCYLVFNHKAKLCRLLSSIFSGQQDTSDCKTARLSSLNAKYGVAAIWHHKQLAKSLETYAA